MSSLDTIAYFRVFCSKTRQSGRWKDEKWNVKLGMWFDGRPGFTCQCKHEVLCLVLGQLLNEDKAYCITNSERNVDQENLKRFLGINPPNSIF